MRRLPWAEVHGTRRMREEGVNSARLDGEISPVSGDGFRKIEPDACSGSLFAMVSLHLAGRDQM